MEVSVVIPNFNGIAFLDSVLASLEGQTLKNFEVIFVDNGCLLSTSPRPRDGLISRMTSTA